MKVLVMGGTGAMGAPLVNGLRILGHDVYITSRREKSSEKNMRFFCGDAHNIDFVKTILQEQFDAIVDFMIYTPQELEERLDLFLKSTNQYVFLSSSRVYAETSGMITETSPRLLDVCIDQDYLKTNEYALAKAREENLLFESGKQNWTIIRPYITYNSQRLQLGVYEKEHWLNRAMNGKTVVIPYDIAQKKTTLTYGGDVAEKIISLIGNAQAYGEAFHVVTDEFMTWDAVLKIYLDAYKDITGKSVNVVYTENSEKLSKIWNKDQIRYDRLYDRTFDNSKIEKATGNKGYTDLQYGIYKCLSEFLETPIWQYTNWRFEAWPDKNAREYTPICNIPGMRMKLAYLKHRFIE